MKLRILERPVVAEFLMSREPIILSRESYDRIASIIRDIGVRIRSRETIVNTVVGAVQNVAIKVIERLIEKILFPEKP